MIPVCWDEISTHPAGTDFTLQLHMEINVVPARWDSFAPCRCLDCLHCAS